MRRLAAGRSLTGALRRVLLSPPAAPQELGAEVSSWPSTGDRNGPSPQLSPGPNNEHLGSARQDEGAPATLEGVTRNKRPEPTAEAEAARELVQLARERGLALTGPDGLLKQLTKTVIETALNEEMTGHLGYEKHDPAGQGTGNGTRPKTTLTDSTGPVGIEVPRDRAGTFEPQIVKKRQRRLTGVDEIVLSLYAKGLTTGEISAHFAEIYGASVSKETVSRITDKVIEEMQSWQNRPLDEA
jgi:putative transposase